MKPIGLLTISSRNYLKVFSVLILISFGVFFFIIQGEVFRSVDEILFNRKIHILEEFKRNDGRIPADVFGYSDFTIKPSMTAVKKDSYSDTLIYETVDREYDEFRKLSTSILHNGQAYSLEIVVARLETHEIINGIVRSLIVTLALMILAFYLTSRFMSRRLWRPFHDTLHQLNQFEIDQSKSLVFTPGRIKEFEELNKSITDLTSRTQASFYNQKQFIENASHEMQTPLAITQSKLELLIADPQLTESQSEIIQTLINSTQRLTRLNRALILLSKIENQQFPEQETLPLKPLVDDVLTNFEEQEENQKIKVTINIPATAELRANRTLIDLLITNLIKNAFVHNQSGGQIMIEGSSDQFIISNTSESSVIPPEKLFQRFYKSSGNRDSWGLGLAIIKKVCDVQGWKIVYDQKDSFHSFRIIFRTV